MQGDFSVLNFEPSFIDEYLQGMMLHDPTVQHIVAHPHQRLVHDSQLISEQEKDRHLYYDWHHRFSDTRHRLAGMASLGENLTSGITGAAKIGTASDIAGPSRTSCRSGSRARLATAST